MKDSTKKLSVLFAAMAVATLSSFSKVALAETETSGTTLDGYNGITVSIGAGAALAADRYRYRRKFEAFQATQVRTTDVVRGTGARLLNRPTENLVDLILAETRHGDVVSIDYTPGTIDELKHAVESLKSSEQAWVTRVNELTKELKAVERRRAVARHQLAELPLKEESRAARERAQARLDEANKEFEYVKKAELDAQSRMHHARGLHAAEKMNLDSSMSSGNKSGKVITTVVRHDIPVGDTTRKQLLNFFEHVTKDKLPKQAKAQMPRIKISRVNMPSYKGALTLLKESRRGFWGIGLGAVVAIEEVTTGYLADGIRESIEPAASVSPRNSRTAQ